MTSPFPHYETLDLATALQPALLNREQGLEVAEHIRELRPGSLLFANFENIERVEADFLRAAFEGISFHVRRQREEGSMVALINTHPGIDNELELVITGARSVLPGVAVGNDQEINLRCRYPEITNAFDAAKILSSKTGYFTSADLAKSLEISVTEVHHRLNVMRKTGALSSWSIARTVPGIKHQYRTITDEDLSRVR